jgi:hypothetical protein
VIGLGSSQNAMSAQPSELNKIAHETALKWFEIHAEQRMSLFKFFLTLFGVSLVAASTAFQVGNSILVCSIGFFIAWISYCFKRLDQRTAQLIKNSEKALGVFSAMYAKELGAEVDVILVGESANGVSTYRETFNRVFWCCGLLGVFIVFLPWMKAT